MPPTMYRCGILVVTLLSVALGEDVLPTSGSFSPDLPESPSPEPARFASSMRDFCFFGKLPSVSCQFKCHLTNKESYCDGEMCLCRAPKGEIDLSNSFQMTQNTGMQPITASTAVDEETDENKDNKHHIFFYIFDFKKIFDRNEGVEEISTTSEAEPQTDRSQDEPEVVAVAGWNYQHLLVLFIIVLLVVLMVIELCAFYKKRNEKNRFERFFNTISISPPNKS